MTPPASPAQRNRQIAKFVALYGGYVLFLHLADGPWRQWKKSRAGRAIDPWTLTHVAWGAIGQRFGLTVNQVLLLESLNEFVEAGVRAARPDLLWGEPESPANVLMDIAATWAGYEIAKRIPRLSG